MSELVQGVLHTVEILCSKVGLLVNPHKTAVVVFSRKLPGRFEPPFFSYSTTLHIGQVPWVGPGFMANLEEACEYHSEEGSQFSVGL